MCLVVFAWQPNSQQPLLLLANRDELHARPSAALAQWLISRQFMLGVIWKRVVLG